MAVLDLRLLPGTLAVCRLDPESPPPAWAWAPSALCAVVRTSDEVAVVCTERAVPRGVISEPGWRAFAVDGPLDLSLTGVLAAIAVPLAEAEVAIYAVSTYDTDYVLVRAEEVERAATALGAAGHRVA